MPSIISIYYFITNTLIGKLRTYIMMLIALYATHPLLVHEYYEKYIMYYRSQNYCSLRGQTNAYNIRQNDFFKRFSCFTNSFKISRYTKLSILFRILVFRRIIQMIYIDVRVVYEGLSILRLFAFLFVAFPFPLFLFFLGGSSAADLHVSILATDSLYE